MTREDELSQFEQAVREFAGKYGTRHTFPTENGSCVLQLPPTLSPDEAVRLLADIGALLVTLINNKGGENTDDTD